MWLLQTYSLLVWQCSTVSCLLCDLPDVAQSVDSHGSHFPPTVPPYGTLTSLNPPYLGLTTQLQSPGSAHKINNCMFVNISAHLLACYTSIHSSIIWFIAI